MLKPETLVNVSAHLPPVRLDLSPDAAKERPQGWVGWEFHPTKSEDPPAPPLQKEPTLTGGFVNYYLVQVNHPQREEQPPYQAECEDIIQALGMTFDEGCAFKALWRSANARRGNSKPDHKMLYDAEKIVHYAKRNLNRVKQEST